MGGRKCVEGRAEGGWKLVAGGEEPRRADRLTQLRVRFTANLCAVVFHKHLKRDDSYDSILTPVSGK